MAGEHNKIELFTRISRTQTTRVSQTDQQLAPTRAKSDTSKSDTSKNRTGN
jgi:hypothetical protein